MMPVSPRCGTTQMEASATSPPSRAPTSPPRLKRAWSPAMIGRPIRNSTSAACVLSATAMTLLAEPRTKSPSARARGVGARAGPGMAAAKHRVAPTATGRLP